MQQGHIHLTDIVSNLTAFGRKQKSGNTTTMMSNNKTNYPNSCAATREREMLFHLNAQAIHCLEQGHYDKAASVFLDSLHTSTLLKSTEDAMSKRKVHCMDNTTEVPAKGPLIGLQRIYPPHSFQNVNQSSECEGIFHLFEYAFLLPENDDCHVLVGEEMLASVCVLYNIGLTYHLRGLSSTSEGDRSMMYRKALDIYGKGLMLMNANCEEGIDADDLLVVLALLNNMGAIHSYYCRQHQMIRCMSMIHELLENSMEQSVMMIEDCCFDFFLIFLIMNPRNCLTTSPAA